MDLLSSAKGKFCQFLKIKKNKLRNKVNKFLFHYFAGTASGGSSIL